MELSATQLSFSMQQREDPVLSLADFERRYRGQLVSWLVANRYCKSAEADTFSALILTELSRQYSSKKNLHLSLIWTIIHKFTPDELSKVRKSMEKNFGLTEGNFEALLQSLQAGEDTLYEQLFLSHFEDCLRFLQRQYRASYEDAYDATMETMLEFMKRLRAGKVAYGNLRFLFTQMAGQVYLKWIKKERHKGSLEGIELGEAPETVDEETLQLLHRAWDGLCNNCQNLLRQFYYDGVALKAIAEGLEKTPAALRKQKQRCVEKLRALFAQYQ